MCIIVHLLVSSSMFRCGAVFVTQPLDLIKNRMQLSGKCTWHFLSAVCTSLVQEADIDQFDELGLQLFDLSDWLVSVPRHTLYLLLHCQQLVM